MNRGLKQWWCALKGHGKITFDKNTKGVRIIEADWYGVFIKVKCDKCGKEFYY
jgi:hypothetical protein